MAFTTRDGRTQTTLAEINMIPFIDIVLVLLIIFMVITPLLQMGYDVKVPPKATVDQPQSLVDQVIVSLTPQNQIFLNKQQVTAPQLAQQLGDILKNRRDKTVFFSGDDGASYGEVIKVMDIVRNAGAKNLGIVLETVPIQ